MNKILDLSIYEEDTIDVKMPKGDVLKVKKPTEELAIKLLSYQSKVADMKEEDLKNDENIKKLMGMLKDLIKDILSNNKDKIEIDDKYLKDNDVNYSMEIAIMNAYTEFMSEITSNPNLKSPQKTRKKKVGK